MSEEKTQSKKEEIPFSATAKKMANKLKRDVRTYQKLAGDMMEEANDQIHAKDEDGKFMIDKKQRENHMATIQRIRLLAGKKDTASLTRMATNLKKEFGLT